MRNPKRIKRMSGYIKLHRAIEQHWLWYDSRHFQWWVQLLFMATWEPQRVTFGNTTFDLQRGQIATTTRILSKKFSCCKQTVQNFLSVLENHNMITRESGQKMTLITIVNYELYQQESEISARRDATQKYASSKHKVDHKVERKIVQIKEERKEEERNINYTLSREDDLRWCEELNQSETFFEESAMSLKISPEDVKAFLSQFKNEMLAQGKYHHSAGDYRSHFFNWMKAQIQKAGARKNNKTNQYTNENKHDKGRGVDPGTYKESDFGGTF